MINVSTRRSSSTKDSKAAAGSSKRTKRDRPATSISSLQQQRVEERQQLYKAQQQRVAARFPSKIKLPTEQRLDRLEAVSATYLAFMDRMLELWESRKCPFVDEDKHLPDKDKQQQSTIEEPAKPADTATSNHHSPYH